MTPIYSVNEHVWFVYNGQVLQGKVRSAFAFANKVAYVLEGKEAREFKVMEQWIAKTRNQAVKLLKKGGCKDGQGN